MPENVTRRVQIEFSTGLPRGTVGCFTLDKEAWVALPQAKYRRILACVDRMLGANNRIRSEMIRWINHWPGDAVRVASILEIIGRTERLAADVLPEKTEARTS